MTSMDKLAEAIAFAHEVEAASVALQSADARELERVAAVAAGAFSRALPPPSALSSRLAADGLGFCAERRASFGGETPGFTTPIERRPSAMSWFMVGAAAAALALWFAMGPTPPSDEDAPMSALRTAAIASGTGAQSAWRAQGGDAPEGDVVWRQGEQDGWLTFRDLPPLPAEKAYQLWIVDGTRSGDPVDGGVFTVAREEQDIIVPIRAALPIGQATAFVVTVEDRRGVVVSKQERVVAVASL
jgi:hypothetical protein